MCIWAKRRAGTGKMTAGLRCTGLYVFDCWHSTHSLAHKPTSLDMLAHMNLLEMMRLEACAPGWPTLWRRSNTCWWKLRGMRGRGELVEKSHHSWMPSIAVSCMSRTTTISRGVSRLAATRWSLMSEGRRWRKRAWNCTLGFSPTSSSASIASRSWEGRRSPRPGWARIWNAKLHLVVAKLRTSLS